MNMTIETKEKIIKAEYGSDKTPLELGTLKIPCYVLENGQRVFSGRGIQRALEPSKKSGTWLKSFISKSTLTEMFSAGENSILDKINNPIAFRRLSAGGSQSMTYGYDVTLLIDICSVILEANRAGIFNDPIIVSNADIIIRSVAKVGIIALVDEVTGYQQDKNRAKDELQRFLNQFLREEASAWVKTFDDSFFEMIYKMRGWTWAAASKKPGVVGQWINDIVYERLAPTILTELQERNPKNKKGIRSKKHHQFLSNDVGRPKLKEHLSNVEALGRASGYNWELFMQLLDRAFPKQSQQFEFLFLDEDKT